MDGSSEVKLTREVVDQLDLQRREETRPPSACAQLAARVVRAGASPSSRHFKVDWAGVYGLGRKVNGGTWPRLPWGRPGGILRHGAPFGLDQAE
jgi:hypothetical protein